MLIYYGGFIGKTHERFCDSFLDNTLALGKQKHNIASATTIIP